MSCPQCFSGHVNPGSPTGDWETVHGLRTYVAKPPKGQEPLGIVVIIPDAFGVDFINNQILADHYASGGQYLVYLPDFMNGQAAKVQTMINMAQATNPNISWLWKPYYFVAAMVDFLPFIIKNRFAVAWPRITDFLKQLREGKGSTLPIGVAGFCWGGQHAIKLAQDTAETRTSSGRTVADAFFAAHPSFVTVPQDIENVNRNLSIAIGDADFVMNMDQTRKAKQILENKIDVDSEVVVYPGAGHGFSVRASKADPDSMETKQAGEAEQQALAWFQRQFKNLASN